MATVLELNTKLDNLTAAIADERQEWLTALADLKARIGNTSPASQADLDALGTRVDDLITKTQGIVDAAEAA